MMMALLHAVVLAPSFFFADFTSASKRFPNELHFGLYRASIIWVFGQR